MAAAAHSISVLTSPAPVLASGAVVAVGLFVAVGLTTGAVTVSVAVPFEAV
jgi:hypothetical protein